MDSLLDNLTLLKYYTVNRPVDIGTYPKRGLVDFNNYNTRQYVEAIGREAWGELNYNRELSDTELSDYEFVSEIADRKIEQKIEPRQGEYWAIGEWATYNDDYEEERPNIKHLSESNYQMYKTDGMISKYPKSQQRDIANEVAELATKNNFDNVNPYSYTLHADGYKEWPDGTRSVCLLDDTDKPYKTIMYNSASQKWSFPFSDSGNSFKWIPPELRTQQAQAEKQEQPQTEKQEQPQTERQEQPQDKKQELYNLVKTTAESYTANPETVAELFMFGSKFYNYSVRNTMLIHAQNPHATYVQSFNAWKDMESSIIKGQKGIKVLVPVKATYLNIDGESIPLRNASKAQKAAYKQGKVESEERLFFKVGHVFDIAQTNFPKERYPEMYNMGYPSEEHSNVIQGLKDYAEKQLNCPVTEEDLQSISLRGQYYTFDNRIVLNEKLEDTEKLSTLSHELGHALIHNGMNSLGKSTAQKEFEADAMSIMIQSHVGIELTKSRNKHLAENYSLMLNEIKKQPDITDKEVLEKSQKVFSSVFSKFKDNVEKMELCIGRYMQEQEQNQGQGQAQGQIQTNGMAMSM